VRRICGECANAVSSGKESQEDPARLGFLLALTATVGAAIMERADAVARNDTKDAVQVLWAPSQANEKPFIAWVDLKLPFGRHPFSPSSNPPGDLSSAWRTVH